MRSAFSKNTTNVTFKWALPKILPLIFILAACGENPSTPTEPCAGEQYLGSWYDDDTGDTLTFASSCQGTSSYCQSTFTTSVSVDHDGDGISAITLRVTATNSNANCPPVGDTVCSYQYVADPDTLGLSCGGGPTLVYFRP